MGLLHNLRVFPDLSRLRARLTPLLLVAGGAAAVVLVVPHLPHEHRVELRLEDAATVTAVDVAWTPVEDGEAVQGSSWHFAAGTAPRSLGSTVKLPNGRYALDVHVERGEGREAFHRVITVGDAERITVPLR